VIRDFYLRAKVPSLAELDKKINVIASFRKVYKFYDVLMLNMFPRVHFVFEGCNKIFLSETLVFAGIDLIYQIFFRYHLACQLLPSGIVNG
jgi:hypothetical protein